MEIQYNHIYVLIGNSYNFLDVGASLRTTSFLTSSHFLRPSRHTLNSATLCRFLCHFFKIQVIQRSFFLTIQASFQTIQYNEFIINKEVSLMITSALRSYRRSLNLLPLRTNEHKYIRKHGWTYKQTDGRTTLPAEVALRLTKLLSRRELVWRPWQRRWVSSQEQVYMLLCM